MDIKVLGTGCPKCRKVYENAKKAIEELGIDSEVEKVEDIDKFEKVLRTFIGVIFVVIGLYLFIS